MGVLWLMMISDIIKNEKLKINLNSSNWNKFYFDSKIGKVVQNIFNEENLVKYVGISFLAWNAQFFGPFMIHTWPSWFPFTILILK